MGEVHRPQFNSSPQPASTKPHCTPPEHARADEAAELQQHRFQRFAHGLHGRGPRRWILLQHRHHQRPQGRRQPGGACGDVGRGRAHVRHHHVHRRLAGEGHRAGEEFEGHDAQRVDVRLAAHLQRARLLWGHGVGGAGHLRLAGLRRLPGPSQAALGKTEVEQLHEAGAVAVCTEENVGRLEVAVYHAGAAGPSARCWWSRAKPTGW
jgi:hypothetical protein